jgi:hypothetical protein
MAAHQRVLGPPRGLFDDVHGDAEVGQFPHGCPGVAQGLHPVGEDHDAPRALGGQDRRRRPQRRSEICGGGIDGHPHLLGRPVGGQGGVHPHVPAEHRDPGHGVPPGALQGGGDEGVLGAAGGGVDRGRPVEQEQHRPAIGGTVEHGLGEGEHQQQHPGDAQGGGDAVLARRDGAPAGPRHHDDGGQRHRQDDQPPRSAQAHPVSSNRRRRGRGRP